ncbi:MAG: hypothetical protein H8E39_00430 [Alphaproteobacteria bacterium]|nr:hypothetical protein [Alphaproteobacteria bacterium]
MSPAANCAHAVIGGRSRLAGDAVPQERHGDQRPDGLEGLDKVHLSDQVAADGGQDAGCGGDVGFLAGEESAAGNVDNDTSPSGLLYSMVL